KGVEKTARRRRETAGTRPDARRGDGALAFAVCLLVFSVIGSQPSAGAAPGFARHTRDYFRQEMPRTVRADHPAIRPVAEAIRAVTTNPLEQLVMVNDVTHL